MNCRGVNLKDSYDVLVIDEYIVNMFALRKSYKIIFLEIS